jgi:hypothetical protein
VDVWLLDRRGKSCAADAGTWAACWAARASTQVRKPASGVSWEQTKRQQEGWQGLLLACFEKCNQSQRHGLSNAVAGPYLCTALACRRAQDLAPAA